MNELALFTGFGGGILASKMLGFKTVCAVERDAYAAQVLAQRQNDGTLEPFPIWSDVSTFDGTIWRGHIDLVSGGFPCQDISPAGLGAGLSGKRSGLWFEFLRIIQECDPRFVFIENSAHIRTKGLDQVIEGLSDAGYSCSWKVLSAKELGANHERKRMWILAHSNSSQCERGCLSSRGEKEYPNFGLGTWWQDKPTIHGVDDGVAYRVERLTGIGNGQVPNVAAQAFIDLYSELNDLL